MTQAPAPRATTAGHVERCLAELQAALAGVRRRWLAARLMRALARLVVGLCLGLLVVLIVDVVLVPPDIPMLVLAGGALVATAVFAVRVLWPLRERPTDRRVARFVEERCPELEDRVASATEIGETGTLSVFQDLVIADAAETLRRVDLGRVVTPARLRGAALRGVLAMAVLAGILTLGVGPFSRVARTAWLYAFGFNVTLDVEPGDVRVMAGQPLRVWAWLSGTRGAPVRTPPTLTVLDGPTPRMVEMRATADGYVAEFPSVTDSFLYRVNAFTLTSRDYRVEALVAPRVRRIDVEYAYPAFTGLAPRVEEDGGDIYAPAGTEVRLLVHTDKAIVAGTLVLSDGRRVALDGAGAGPLTATFSVETDGSYTIAVTDVDGLSNGKDTEYVVRATVDRAPDVYVLRPGGDREITPLEEVTIEVRADDDYGVGALELVYTVVGQPEQSIRFQTAGAQTVTGSHTLYAEDLGVAPGDFITYYARARDVGYAGQSTEARSDIFFLEIRSFDHEFEEAQSRSGIGRDAEDIGKLAAVQKEIIVATWRLDPAPRSAEVADDIRAVGEAQRELRDAAAIAAERVLGRGQEVSAGVTEVAPENAAMARAVEAMTEAQTALAALSTERSLPHELEALTQLLKAQGAMRGRQVAMQQGQGSQTPGTQAQEDLSALFDRELRREQETNYETRTSPDQQAQDDESEALRRLRELAARQAEINRELAERETAEPDDALRRTLERLTREQQELREQLEALAAQIARARQASGQSQGQPSGASSTADLRRIADEMRRTMSELRRQDTRHARASGVRVLEEMRRLEQRLRGTSDERWSVARAELQLEAQQLADAQRRVADEAGQVEADNRSRESRFRLADEKDDLADRVDTLHRALEDLTADRSTADPVDVPVRAARDELEREAVGPRMRAGADRLRRSVAGSPPAVPELDVGGPADEDTALADVLARVAAQLRRATGQDEAARRLMAQMEAARELRQSLEQLQTELDAQQRQQTRQAAAHSAPPDADRSSAQDARPGGAVVETGADPQEREAGRPISERRGGSSAGGGTLAELRREYLMRLESSRDLLDALRRQSSALDRDLDRWARQWQSVSAPGTEVFKQDLAHWDSLRRNLENALHQFEAERSRALAAGEIRDRLSAGSEEPLPARYRRLVDQYYRALATAPESP